MKPIRRNKNDVMVHGRLSKAEIQCDYAVAEFDGVARQMDLKWGVDRLVDLVPTEMAQRYGVAREYLNEAIQSEDPDKVTDAASNCVRGMVALDAEAERTGQPKAHANVLEYADGETHFAILPDAGYWPAVKEARPDLRFFTLAEIASMVKAWKLDAAIVDSVKDSFRGATITAVRPKLDVAKGDEIPL